MSTPNVIKLDWDTWYNAIQNEIQITVHRARTRIDTMAQTYSNDPEVTNLLAIAGGQVNLINTLGQVIERMNDLRQEHLAVKQDVNGLADILAVAQKWMKTYTPTMKKAKKYFADLVKKA